MRPYKLKGHGLFILHHVRGDYFVACDNGYGTKGVTGTASVVPLKTPYFVFLLEDNLQSILNNAYSFTLPCSSKW